MSDSTGDSLGIWSALKQSKDDIAGEHMLNWFDQDPHRAEKLTHSVDGITVDFSKQRINDRIFAQLLSLAESSGLEEAIEGMFTGRKLNTSEDRAVLHVALRNSVSSDLVIDGQNISQLVQSELQRMLNAAEAIRDGEWQGCTGHAITDVVHIGIGGSDLGPRMVTRALTPYHNSRVNIHFVSNLDATELVYILRSLAAETTLFIVASKSFTTEETLNNATLARNWLLERTGNPQSVARQMVALSSSPEQVKAFGIEAHNRFEFWDWVGGRFSVWSVIGMPIAIAIGSAQFREFLAGASAMDHHFQNTPWRENLPVIMGLTGLWNRNFLGSAAQAVVPYYHFLDLLPQYLQQAEMESNGKRVTSQGEELSTPSSPVIFGSAGTDAQHAYFQMLHQGTDVIPVDFVVSATCEHEHTPSHQKLVSHAIAQGEALLRGRVEENPESELANHRLCPGNRPSTMLLLESINPRNLGSLLALYEHRIFVAGTILGINSFDQFGVELGKKLAAELQKMLDGEQPVAGRDASTTQFLQRLRGKDEN